MSVFFCERHQRVEDSDFVGFNVVHLEDPSPRPGDVLTGAGRKIESRYVCDDGVEEYTKRRCIDCDTMVRVTARRCSECEAERQWDFRMEARWGTI